MCSGIVRTICASVPSSRGGGICGAARPSPVTSRHRIAKCSATSPTTGPPRTESASCQPRAARAQWDLASRRSPASDVRSIPPTKAMRSSMMVTFSWWQCIGRSRESSAHCTRVPVVSPSRIARTTARDGWKSGRGGPAQASTRTGTFSAVAASRFRSTDAASPRRSAKSGEKCQPARWTCDSAPAMASARRGSASAPSTRISTELPGRGGGSPAAQPPAGASSTASFPRRLSRRRW